MNNSTANDIDSSSVIPLLISGSYDGRIMFWNTSRIVWKADKEITLSPDLSINYLCLSSDSLFLGVAHATGIKIYKVEDNEQIMSLEERYNVLFIEFTPKADGLIYTLENGVINYIDLINKQRRVLINEGVDVYACELCQNGFDLLIGTSTGNIRNINIITKLEKNPIIAARDICIRSIASTSEQEILFVGDSLGFLYTLLQNNKNVISIGDL